MAITALIFFLFFFNFLIFFSSLIGQIFPVFSSISTKIGLAPEYKIQLLVATKLNGVVNIISFFFQPSAKLRR